MQEHNKTYSEYSIAYMTTYKTQSSLHPGFTLTMLEYVQTIPTFWDTMTEFIKKNPQYLDKDNAMDFLSNDQGKSYSLCHCERESHFLAPGASGY